ncbi:L,D-transpeptidase [Streptomyces violascens]|uniref:L,D-transpeptidase n=1 Tax=Streptomyces violascens TaxID=67381 RepID=UPI001CFD51C6|nr:Ig-like domain-containing protein [Streptomyces violascens]
MKPTARSASISAATSAPASTSAGGRIRARHPGITPLLALFAVAVLALGGCSSGGGKDTSPSPSPTVSKARITTTPKDGADHVGITVKDVGASVADGTFTSVTLMAQGGKAIPGALTPARTAWHPSANLTRGTAYTLTAEAKDPDGRAATTTTRFTTVSENNSAIAFYTPEDASTVGVGMEVSFRFDKAVTDRRAAESAVKITSSSGQQATGHWFGDRRIDFRPQDYWKPDSKVTVAFDFDGLELAKGIYGVQDKSFSFTVGREQISTVDAATQEMTVRRGGATVKRVPVSTGQPKYATYNGTMVISEQDRQTKMNSTTVGLGDEYDIPDVPHAQRLTNSGTFIHGNYWAAPSTFGATAASHGCIGLQDTQGGGDPDSPAAWFYANSLLGDVVIVRNSTAGGTVAPDNGLNGWNLPWTEWTAGSALPHG